MGNASSQDTTTATATKQGFGESFAKARKQRAWSVEDVAGELNILKRHVVAMEEENYEALPDFAFARGFVINYAKLLQIDIEEIAKQFEKGYPAKLRQDTIDSIKAPLQPMSTLYRGRTPVRLNFGLIVGIVGVLLLGVAILKIINGATAEEAVASTETHVADTLSPTEQAQGAAIGTGSALANSSVGTGSALGANADNTNPATTNANGASSSAANGGAAVIDLWVKGNVVMQITDATGTVLISGTQSRGGKQLTGQAPFTVVIEDTSKVDLNLNQNPIRLREYTQNGRASFTLQ
ncbi:MAG: DUF4115 domain-containing protein [Moraxella sp.]|nr:DUF4115 domain-containing protein [Moraxella sp.]